MADISTTSAFGETPEGPLFYAKRLVSFMTAAWNAEDEFHRAATEGSKPTEFSALMPRVHADVLEIVGCLITVSSEIAAAERHGGDEFGGQS